MARLWLHLTPIFSFLPFDTCACSRSDGFQDSIRGSAEYIYIFTLLIQTSAFPKLRMRILCANHLCSQILRFMNNFHRRNLWLATLSLFLSRICICETSQSESRTQSTKVTFQTTLGAKVSPRPESSPTCLPPPLPPYIYTAQFIPIKHRTATLRSPKDSHPLRHICPQPLAPLSLSCLSSQGHLPPVPVAVS